MAVTNTGANFASSVMGASAIATNVSASVGAGVNIWLTGEQVNANRINAEIKAAGYLQIPKFT